MPILCSRFVHCCNISRMIKMIQKERYNSSGFSSFTLRLLACLVFLAIIITTGTTITTASSLPRPRGIAAIPLTSQSEFSAAAAASAKERQKQKIAYRQPDGVKCKTEQGDDVDWFIAYKLPKNRTSSNTLVRAGLAYAYILPRAATAEVNVQAPRILDVSDTWKKVTSYEGSYSGGNDSANNNNVTAAFENEDGNFRIPAGLAGTSKKAVNAWTLSTRGIDSPGSMVGQTLGKLFVKDNRDVAFLTYNDQPPVGPTIDTGGHTKGIIVTSLASGGIWIQHSVPHFPLIDTNNYHYQYPGTGRINGQVFHCVSFSSTKDIDDLANIFEITKPHVANFSFPTNSFKNAFPKLSSIANHSKHLENKEKSQLNPEPSDVKRLQSRQAMSAAAAEAASYHATDDGDETQVTAAEAYQSPCINEIDERACLNKKLMIDKLAFMSGNEEAGLQADEKNWDLMEIRSAGGISLKAFVKGPSFHEDIYSSWIAPTYKTKLDVQSWLNGPHPFVSNCSVSEYSVYNIIDKNIAGQAFSTHNDHSKWAMSVSAEQALICISDLNRMEHQLKRGGVAVCFTDVTVWTTFSKSVIDVQPCPRLHSASTVTNTISVSNGTGDRALPTSSVGTSLILSPSAASAFSPKLSTFYTEDNNRMNMTSVYGNTPKKLVSVTRKSRHQKHRRHMFERKVKSRTNSFVQ